MAWVRQGRFLQEQSNEATTYYQQALALAEALGMRPLQTHCHLGLGTLYAMTGQQQQAHAALSAAMALYCAMDMTFWVPHVEAALSSGRLPTLPQRRHRRARRGP